MAEITITIRADEDDLTAFVGPMHDPRFSGAEHRLRHIVIAALPKPRIVVKPGMVLRRNSDGLRFMAHDGTVGCYLSSPYARPIEVHAVWENEVAKGLDPAEWTVILDAEDAP